MKVRAGGWYIYCPVGWDVFDAKTTLATGERVQVKNMPGCPPANTGGCAHVLREDGTFAGLVSIASLSTEERA